MTDNTKAVLAIGTFVAGVAGLLILANRRRRAPRRAIGDAASRGVLDVAADAFMEGDIARGEEVLKQLPEKQRTLARCIRARKKRYEKGDYWKGWKQISQYRLYRPLVMDPLHGSTPKQHAYTEVTVNATRETNLADGNVTDWITVLGDLGPTENYPEGEYRFLVSEQRLNTSHRDTLRRLGYDVVVPCGNVPLSGMR